METSTEKQTVVAGFDDSEHILYATKCTLDHFFINFASNSPFKLVIVHSKPSHSHAIGFAGPGAADVLPVVGANLKKIAARVVEQAKKRCTIKLVKDVVIEVVDGDARNVLCEDVERHHASMLVVGSHGYRAI